jgi:hypothetical protein
MRRQETVMNPITDFNPVMNARNNEWQIENIGS